jgi:hypothetical protein
MLGVVAIRFGNTPRSATQRHLALGLIGTADQEARQQRHRAAGRALRSEQRQ